jgi:hypothetical protein
MFWSTVSVNAHARIALSVILLAGCANVEERRDPHPGDRYALTLTEVFPEQRSWQGNFTLGAPHAARPGSYAIANLSAVVGYCSRVADCTYAIQQIAGVFDPKLEEINPAEPAQRNAKFVAIDRHGKYIGNLSFKGKDWVSYNVREARDDRNGSISTKRLP